jgi:outer membrane protein assembly factor BamB
MAPRTLVALLLGAALSATAGSASTSSPAWPQFHFDAAHTGFNQDENTLGPQNVSRLKQAWSVQAGAAVDWSVAVSDGLVFATSDDNTLHAYRAADGSEAWSALLAGASHFGASPAVVGGTVFAYTSSSIVSAFDAATGASRWSESISGIEGAFPGSPTVAGDLVYALPYELVALEQATGRVRWTRNNVGCFVCSPAVADGVLYIGGGPAVGRRLLALDAETGAQRWAFKPRAGRGFSWSASPAVDGGSVFQSAFAEGKKKIYSLYAFSASSGKKRWKVVLGSSKYLTASAPAVAHGVVYFASPGGKLYAFRATTGKVLWSYKLGMTDSSPAIANGVIYASAGHTLSALDARTGKKIWSVRAASDVSTPVVVGGSLFVGSADGTIFAYRVP